MKHSLENLNTALVHDWLTVMAGGERTLLAISEIFTKAPIYTTVFNEQKVLAFKDRDVRTSFLQKMPMAKKQRELVVPFSPIAFEQFDMSPYDLVVSSSSMAAKGVITNPGCTHVCYCHTPSRYLWEPNLDIRASSGRFSSLRRKVAHQMRIWDRVAADRVDYFVANSKYIQKRIAKYYQRDSVVIYPPVDLERFKPASVIGNYYLFVSRLVDYKHPELVVQAFNELELPLKIIGSGPMRPHLQKIAKKNIEFLGYLSDSELSDCYAGAQAFVFPAEEDFGIVAVEALASGRPVVAYKEGGAAEVVEEGKTGVLFDSQTVKSLVSAVKSFKSDLFCQETLVELSKKYSKTRFKHELAKYISSVLNN
ncbi:MAG TPA: glycosyltransferase [bacterium]|nr:glycosyltransferase [bacterium]